MLIGEKFQRGQGEIPSRIYRHCCVEEEETVSSRVWDPLSPFQRLNALGNPVDVWDRATGTRLVVVTRAAVMY